MKIILITILLIVAYICNGLMDRSSEGKFKNKKLNKGFSWANKYKTPLEPYNKVWYYTIIIGEFKIYVYTPSYKEKYPFSSTLFVAFSDFWHALKFVLMTCIKISICIAFGSILIYPILQFGQWLGFYIGYNKFKKYLI